MDCDDIVAIEQLIALYGHVVDAQALDRLDEVFRDDAVFDLTAMGGERYVGLDAIRRFFALGAPPHPPSHHTTNVHVTDRGADVLVLSKWLSLDWATGGVKTGDYADRVALTPGGWRITDRTVTARWFVGEVVRASSSR